MTYTTIIGNSFNRKKTTNQHIQFLRVNYKH